MLLDLIHGALTIESQLLQRAKHIYTELLVQSKITQCGEDCFLSQGCNSDSFLRHFD